MESDVPLGSLHKAGVNPPWRNSWPRQKSRDNFHSRGNIVTSWGRTQEAEVFQGAGSVKALPQSSGSAVEVESNVVRQRQAIELCAAATPWMNCFCGDDRATTRQARYCLLHLLKAISVKGTQRVDS
jgi:hypothetical protein